MNHDLRRTSLRGRLRETLANIDLIDSHERFASLRKRRDLAPGAFALACDCCEAEFIASGASTRDLESFRSRDFSFEERWDRFEERWESIRLTGAARAFVRAARDLHGIEALDRRGFLALEDASRALDVGRLYREALRDKGRIESTFFDAGPNSQNLFGAQESCRPLLRPEDVAWARSKADLGALEIKFDATIHTLRDLVRVMGMTFERAEMANAAALLLVAPPRSELIFEKTSKPDAERLFDRIAERPEGALSYHEARPLHDYLAHQAIRHAEAMRLPIQIATRPGREGEALGLSLDPSPLQSLIREYSQAIFVLQDAAYPYESQAAALARAHPNLHLDLGALWTVAPRRAEGAIRLFLDTVPSGKLHAYGGGARHVEMAYAGAQAAREGIAEILVELIECGDLDEDSAPALARGLLRGNAAAIYPPSRFTSDDADRFGPEANIEEIRRP